MSSSSRKLTRREQRIHSRLLREIHDQCTGKRCLRSLPAERERCPNQVRENVAEMAATAAFWQALHLNRRW